MIILVSLLTLFILAFLGIFFYTWYRLHTAFHVHVGVNEDHILKYKAKDHKTHYFTTSDGVKIASWYFPIKKPKAVVILIHGYVKDFGGKPLMLGHIEYLGKAGYSTLVIDLRSVGESEGSKVSMGIHEWKDVAAAYDYAKSLPENKTIPVGFLSISMGAATTIIAAALSQKGDFVIASVPYASFTRMFDFQVKKEKLYAPIFLPPLLLAAHFELGWNYEQYAPINLISRIHAPILLFSAKHDDFVHGNDATSLYEKANQPKEYWQANTRHDIFTEDTNQAIEKVLSFLKKYTPGVS